jgi:hypothetical protein
MPIPNSVKCDWIVWAVVELRQPGRDGDADLGAGLVQLRLGGTHVGALLDQLRRQADYPTFATSSPPAWVTAAGSSFAA